jgi:hypothetical protein
MSGRGYYEEYTLEELKKLLPNNREIFEFNHPSKTIEEQVTSDDRFSSKAWTQAYKLSAYYYDNPSNDDRMFFLNKFRFNFGNLLAKTANPNEIPSMNSRSDFVGWVCKKHNEFLEKENANFTIDCNVEKLLKTYGPNYDKVKDFIGEYDFYY